MQRQAQRSTRNGRLRLGFGLAVLIAAAVAIGLWAFRVLSPPATPFLTGTYRADDGGIYYLQRSGNTLWWAGMSLDTGLSAELQWHRGLTFTNVYQGTINPDNTVVGQWSDVPRGATLSGGALTLRIGTSGGVTQLTRLAVTGDFGAKTWRKTDPLDDAKFNGTTTDIVSRFDQVHKPDKGSIHDNLDPYRDQTVLYGRLTNNHLDYTNDNNLDPQIPHVNYGPDFSSPIPAYVDFGKRNRDFDSFTCNQIDSEDADFDMRLKVDLDKLEPDFYTTGWGDRTSGPQVFAIKLNDPTTRQKLGFATNEGYMGLEALMYGRPGTCDDGHATPANGGLSMLPGWADLSSNSVLINGRPIDGSLHKVGLPGCDFAQPCPFLNEHEDGNVLDKPAGIRLGDFLLSAKGNGQIDAKGNVGQGAGTYVRVTGALVLDCGHFFWSRLGSPCFDQDSILHPDDISGHQNQEIHPIYSIDVINFPYRPEDLNLQGPTDLTGTYGGSDGSTYYVRETGGTNIHQPGKTIFWLGLMRDRQPIQPGTQVAIIGSIQLKPAFDANDPGCSSGQCWAFANVFKGTITDSPGETIIEGDWAGVPQSASSGSSGGHMKFFVFNHKIIVPATPSIFPVAIEKMYDPPGFGGSSGTVTQGTP
jgi:hypothetical protein